MPGWTDAARAASAAARARKGAYGTKPLSGGKVGVFRKGTGSLVGKFGNAASAEHHIGRQEAEDHEWRVNKVKSYLDERSARPPRAREVSAQMDMFGAAHQSGVRSRVPKAR